MKLKQDALFCPLISLKENWSCYAELITYDTNVLTPNRLKMHEIKKIRKFINYFFCHNHLFMFFLLTIIHHFRSTKQQSVSYMDSSCNAYGDEYILRFPWTFFVPIYFPSITGFDCVIIIVINVSVVYDSHLKSNGMVYLSIAIVMFRKYYY